MATIPLTRVQAVRSSFGLGSACAVGCVTAAALTRSPLLATTAVLALGLVVVGLTAPRALLLTAILNLAWTPEFVGAHGLVGGSATRSFLYLCALPLLFQRGLEPRLLLVPGAYVLLGVLSALGGSPAPELTAGQSLSTLAALSLVWIVLAIRWAQEDRSPFLRALAWIPTLSVAIGLLLQGAGLHELVVSNPTPRLCGAMIAPYLGGAALGGFAAAIVLWRYEPRRELPWLAAVNALIICATVSRGSLIGLTIAGSPLALRFLASSVGPRLHPLRILVGGIVVVTVLAAALPLFTARNREVGFVNGVGEVSDPTSGRSAAWSQFYAAARENIVFGRGLGAGPVIRIEQQGFLAQHNEYLRLLVEGGLVGGMIVLAAIVATITMCIRRAPSAVRPDLIALALAFAFLSLVDNSLSVTQMAVPVVLVFGLAGAGRPWRPQRVTR